MGRVIARELKLVIDRKTIVLSAYGRYNSKRLEYATLKRKRLQDRISIPQAASCSSRSTWLSVPAPLISKSGFREKYLDEFQ
jgi:hypothetical protein